MPPRYAFSIFTRNPFDSGVQEFGSTTAGRKEVRKRLRVPARVFCDAAIPLVNWNADLIHLLAIDHHGLDSPGDHGLCDIEAPRAGYLPRLATPDPHFVSQLGWNFNERLGNELHVHRVVFRPVVVMFVS